MDDKRLKGHSVNVECTFPCYKEHDTPVEASRARDLVADEPRQITPELVPSPEGHLDDGDDDDDDDGDDLIDKRYPRPTATLCESPQAGLEEPVIETDGKRDDTGEPEQRSTTLDPAAEPDGEQETAGEQWPPLEGDIEPGIPSDMGIEPTLSTERGSPRQMSTSKHKRRPSAGLCWRVSRLHANVGHPTDGPNTCTNRWGEQTRDRAMALIDRIPWLGRHGGRSSVAVAS